MNQQNLFLEIRNSYTEYLIDVLTPLIFEGLQSIYNNAVKETEGRDMNNKVLFVFQEMLQNINQWNRDKLEKETQRIKHASNTASYFDNLVFAVCKCNIILLSYSNDITSPVIKTYMETFDPVNFIHRCYIECGKESHNLPFLFYHKVDPLDIKRNNILLTNKIREGISRAIRKILPYETLLKEFLINTTDIIQNVPMLPPKTSVKRSEHYIDDRVKSETMKVISNDMKKSDSEKVQEIIQLDKILSSIKPNPLEQNILNIKISEQPPVTPHQSSLRLLEAFGVSETPVRPY